MKLYLENLIQDLHKTLASTVMNSWYINYFRDLAYLLQYLRRMINKNISYTLTKLFLKRRREFEELAFPTRSRVGWSNNIDETVDCLSVETGCF